MTSGGCNLTAKCQQVCDTVNIGVPPRIFKLLRIVRLAKLAKLAKLLKLKNSKGKDDDSAVNSTGPSVKATIALLLVQMFYVAHWVACFRHFQTLAPTYAGALGLEDAPVARRIVEMATSTTTSTTTGTIGTGATTARPLKVLTSVNGGRQDSTLD